MTVKYVHPAEPTIELIIDQHFRVLLELVPFARSGDFGHASGASPASSRFDEGNKLEDLATAHGR